jgi:hypothetical protein
VRFVVALFVFPAVVVALATGAGLLVDRVAGRPLPGLLIPTVGLALLVAIAELCVYTETTAPLAPFAIAAVGVGGYAFGVARLRGLEIDRWAVAASVAVYLIAIAPVLLAGRVTVAGYLLDTTAAFQLEGADYLVDHGSNFDDIPDSAYRGMLVSYFGHQYPTGGQSFLGAAGRIVFTDRIWLYQPFLSLMLAFCAPALYHLARSASVPKALAAAGATIASVPALVYAYTLMGAIKELTVLPFVLVLGCFLVLLPRLLERGPRGAIVPAVVCAAGVAGIGFAFLPWVGATGLAGLALLAIGARPELPNLGRVASFAAALGLLTVVLALPSFGQASSSAHVAGSFNTGITDPGNLLEPLKPVQMFGIWLSGTHRRSPVHVGQTYLLIGIAAAAALLGAVHLLRRRLWSLAAFMVVMGVVWVVLTRRGAIWTDAKLLVITSPALMLLVLMGVESLRRGGRRIEALLVGGIVAFGVLASNAHTYHSTNLLPTDRYDELMDIGERFGDLSPTLTPEFDEFDFYALPDMAADGPGFAHRTSGLSVLRDGSGPGYGHSYDVDRLLLPAVERYEAIVARRRPDASRPPGNFELAYRGTYYDVWRRVDRIEVLEHEPGGVYPQPASAIPCGRVRQLGERAEGAGAQLAYVERPQIVALGPDQLARFRRPAAWGAGPQGVALIRAGVMEGRVRVPEAGPYRLWIAGDVGRPVDVSVDGRHVGEIAGESGNEGNFLAPLEVDLSAGGHTVRLERGGRGLAPGDGTPSRVLAIMLEPRPAARDEQVVRTRPAASWRRLCNRPVDWIEAVWVSPG